MTHRNTIVKAWQSRDTLSPSRSPRVAEAVYEVLDDLDAGRARVAERVNGEWIVNEWLKMAVLLSFRLFPMRRMEGAPDGSHWWDKVPPKFSEWSEDDFQRSGVRAVPTAYVRRSAHVAPGVVLMPSFVNVGAYIGSGTMVDTWATVGSCAQIGSNCHISGGVGIGGVLEPLQASPVIVEDSCFIGARSEVVEGVVVEEGSVISMGVFLGASTKIVERRTGTIHRGRVPAYSVVVPGTIQEPDDCGIGRLGLQCAVIIKTVDKKTRAKTALNELLRD